MSYIVHGARGAQGAPLKARLLDAGHEVYGGSAPFDSVDGLIAAYRDADGIFVHLPMAPEPVRQDYARAIVAALDAARPKRVVISTSGTIVDQPGTPPQAAPDSAVAMLIDGAERSNISTAVVATRLYLENLLLPMVSGPVSDEGKLRYPIPADYLVSWVSHLDVAQVAERLLTDHSVTGIVGVGHLPGLDGNALAHGFAAHLGRPVSFEALTPDQFGDLLEPVFGPASQNVVQLYRALAQVEANVIDERTSAQRLLGLAPRSLAEWLTSIER